MVYNVFHVGILASWDLRFDQTLSCLFHEEPTSRERAESSNDEAGESRRALFRVVWGETYKMALRFDKKSHSVRLTEAELMEASAGIIDTGLELVHLDG